MKKLLSVFLAISFMCCTFSVCAAPAYSDNVAPLLAELKIMQGDTDGNLRLNDLVSRAECTKMVVAASAYRDTVAAGSKTSPFSDVSASHWAAPYITVAVKNGLCKGYLDSTFRPGNTVLYEEALTMFLRVLGYSEADFGTSWPNGQIGIAKNIGLCDGLLKQQGDEMTRRDMMIVAYNMLNTPAKGSGQNYISEFDRTIMDDVVLISTNREDVTIGTNKVLTSAGMFKITEDFPYSDIGKKGSISLRNGDTIVAFIPDTSADSLYADTKNYVVYSLLGDSVITYENGNFGKVNFVAGTVFYESSQQTTYSAISQKLQMGDVLKIKYNDNGTIDYVVYDEGESIGPVTVKNTGWYNEFGVDLSTVSIMRDGVKSTASDVQINDIAYYAKELNMFLVYSKKVTGVYESATPNKDTPVSVTVSGITYALEGVGAFEKLSSNGSFQYGDTVTLLLGKNGEVADVATQAQLTTEVVGYLVETGRKETAVNGSKVTNPYVRLILPNGSSVEYTTGKEYDSLRNQPVRIRFQGGTAIVSPITSQSAVSGTLQWNSSTKAIGSSKLAQSVNIIEVSTVSVAEEGNAATVFPIRLNGMRIAASDVLYAKKDSDGNITDMILRDVTGDMHTYGVVTKANTTTENIQISGSYTYLQNGIEKSLSTNGKAYTVATGQPVQIKISERGTVTGIVALNKSASGKVTNITANSLTMNGKVYTLSDKVDIYIKSSYNYTMMTTEEFKASAGDYSATLYSDNRSGIGGRIRIIIVTPK